MRMSKDPSARLVLYFIFFFSTVWAIIKLYPPAPFHENNEEEDSNLWPRVDDRFEEFDDEDTQVVTSENRSQEKTNENFHIPNAAIEFLKRAGDVLLSVNELDLMLELLHEFHRISRLRRLKYILYGGTLLGAYRHSGFIDYYDTLKVLISVHYKPVLREIFHGTNITILKADDTNVKLFLLSTFYRRHVSYRHPWPHIQLSFFQLNGAFLKDLNGDAEFETSKVFPLIRLPFEGLLLPAPRCPEYMLSTYLSVNFVTQCCTGDANNKFGVNRSERSECIACALLHGLLPFTSWRRLNQTHAREVVSPVLRGKPAPFVISERTLTMPECSRY